MISPAQHRKPIPAEKRRREEARNRATTGLTAALDGCEDVAPCDIAYASIDAWVGYLAKAGHILRVSTHLRAMDGRLAPAIKSTERCQLDRQTFGGRG